MDLPSILGITEDRGGRIWAASYGVFMIEGDKVVRRWESGTPFERGATTVFHDRNGNRRSRATGIALPSAFPSDIIGNHRRELQIDIESLHVSSPVDHGPVQQRIEIEPLGKCGHPHPMTITPPRLAVIIAFRPDC